MNGVLFEQVIPTNDIVKEIPMNFVLNNSFLNKSIKSENDFQALQGYEFKMNQGDSEKLGETIQNLN